VSGLRLLPVRHDGIEHQIFLLEVLLEWGGNLLVQAQLIAHKLGSLLLTHVDQHVRICILLKFLLDKLEARIGRV